MTNLYAFNPAGADRPSAAMVFSDRCDSPRGVKNSQLGNLDMDGFCGFIRHIFPTAHAAHVAALTGIPASTADKWLRYGSSEGRKPSGEHLVLLVAAFGPSFLLASMKRAPDWLKQAGAADEKARIEAQILHLAKRAAELSA